MTHIEKLIVETWRIHNRSCLFLIKNLPQEAMHATLSTRGGRDIARQLAHLRNVRAWRLQAFSKKIGRKLVEFETEEHPNKKTLLEALEESGDVMERYVQHCIDNGGKVSNFKRGVVPMIGYYIAHEAHHRGNIYLTMKQCGIRIPDTLKWGIWEWNKI